ncbi:hypothetical protein Athai_59200 [Actinocatenispora thailandica]|uniref:DUF4259 domain-containing protein n=1 Tax=Actinocatenispora thailandica TaxID=227318 RepID=A0A7R7DW18_9ACTN|nr:DUF4259 domain-containing protein [Actinocatenispora thailandica]BCJ38417.1 hypothetical protein Athai_59200 [Actinocatenispora thailandica]
MGAWDTGIFDNDGAGDLHAELLTAAPAGRADVLRSAFALPCEEYVEVDEGQRALAAAAVVSAAAAGTDLTAYGRSLPAADLPAATPELVALARAAVDRVLGADSEWRELWDEAELGADAFSAAAKLRAGLS